MKRHNHHKKNKKKIHHSIKKSLIVLSVLILFVFILSFSLMPDDDNDINQLSDIFEKEKPTLNEAEFKKLTGLSCDELREVIKTEKNTCIYFKDENNRLIMLENGKYGIGCNGLTLDGNKIC